MCFISFIFPVLAKWWLHARSYRDTPRCSAAFWLHFAFPAAVLVVGVLISVLGLAATINHLVSNEGVCAGSDSSGGDAYNATAW